MVKKILLVSFLVVLLFAPLYPVYAEDSTSSGSTTRSPKPIRPKLEKKIEKVEDRLERIASKTAQLKERLGKFKDQKKAKVVERINEELNKINTRQTDNMAKHLAKMTEILGKVEDRSASNSANTTDVQTAIVDAKGKIASASAAVEVQADKDYSISVSSESGVRADAKKTRDMLHTDLKATRGLVQEARASVAAAISSFAQALGGATNP